MRWIKKIVMLLGVGCLFIILIMPKALAAEDVYTPIVVDAYTAGNFDELRISKVYRLSPSDDPTMIPTEDFVQGGRRYYLLDIVRETSSEGNEYSITYTAIFGSEEIQARNRTSQETVEIPLDTSVRRAFLVAGAAILAMAVKRAKQRL